MTSFFDSLPPITDVSCCLDSYMTESAPPKILDPFRIIEQASIHKDLNSLKKIIQRIGVNATNDLGLTPLHLCIQNGFEEGAQFLIRHNADIHATDYAGNTPLHLAATHGLFDSSQWLLSKDADVNAENIYGETPLHLACIHQKNLPLISFLVHYLPTNLQSQDKKGNTSLHYLAKSQNLHINNFFILPAINAKKPLNIHIKNNKGFTALQLALKSRLQANAIFLLGYQNSATLPDAEGNTPLHLAASEGLARVTVVLVSKLGIHTNKKNCTERTPLHLACISGKSPSLISFFIKHPQTFISSQDIFQRTPLHYLIKGSSTDTTISFLKSAKKAYKAIKINSIDTEGNTALHYAIQYNTAAAKELLHQEGIDPNPQNEKGETPFSLLFDNTDTESFNYDLFYTLLHSIGHVNTQNEKGETPLHKAVALEDPTQQCGEIIRPLLKQKYNGLNTQDKEGRTPLHRALECRNYEACRLLIAHPNIQVNLQDKRGNTPLHKAYMMSDARFLNLLLASHKNFDHHIRNNAARTPFECNIYGLPPEEPKTLQNRSGYTLTLPRISASFLDEVSDKTFLEEISGDPLTEEPQLNTNSDSLKNYRKEIF